MLEPVKLRIVGKAIIIRYVNGEGTVDQIIAKNYPVITKEDQTRVKAFVISKRPQISNSP